MCVMCKDPDEQPHGGEQLSTLDTECRQVDYEHQPQAATHTPPQATASETRNPEENASFHKKETLQTEDTMSEDNKVSTADPTKQLNSVNITIPQSEVAQKH